MYAFPNVYAHMTNSGIHTSSHSWGRDVVVTHCLCRLPQSESPVRSMLVRSFRRLCVRILLRSSCDWYVGSANERGRQETMALASLASSWASRSTISSCLIVTLSLTSALSSFLPSALSSFLPSALDERRVKAARLGVGNSAVVARVRFELPAGGCHAVSAPSFRTLTRGWN
jgi:hypothetical protein